VRCVIKLHSKKLNLLRCGQVDILLLSNKCSLNSLSAVIVETDPCARFSNCSDCIAFNCFYCSLTDKCSTSRISSDCIGKNLKRVIVSQSNFIFSQLLVPLLLQQEGHSHQEITRRELLAPHRILILSVPIRNKNLSTK